MRVLLLGPNGQLGSDIRRLHAETGEPLELIPLGRGALDVAAPQALHDTLAALDFNLLINCTGYHKTDEVELNAALAFAVNAHAVETMARECAKKGARFVHVSTDYVFGGDTQRVQPLRESDATAPVNVYGSSKVMGETVARLVHDDVVVLRVASLFGVSGASGKGGNFVETMLRVGREKGLLRVVDDQTMSPTATADVARTVLDIVVKGCAPGTYHVVNRGAATWFDFAREIVRQSSINVTVEPCSTGDFPARAIRPRYSALDNAKVEAEIGAMPTWQEALERYLRAKRDMTGHPVEHAKEQA